MIEEPMICERGLALLALMLKAQAGGDAGAWLKRG